MPCRGRRALTDANKIDAFYLSILQVQHQSQEVFDGLLEIVCLIVSSGANDFRSVTILESAFHYRLTIKIINVCLEGEHEKMVLKEGEKRREKLNYSRGKIPGLNISRGKKIIFGMKET